MLEGFVPFPPEFAKRYREKGYWHDKSLAEEFAAVFRQYADRVAFILPNVIEFVFLYFALQNSGCIPIAALATHRYLEVSQFVQLSGATTCVVPERAGDFDFQDMVERMRADGTSVKHGIVYGQARRGFASLSELIEQAPRRSPGDLRRIKIDP